MTPSTLKEHIVVFANAGDNAAVTETILAASGKVILRSGAHSFIFSLDKPDAGIKALLPAGAALLGTNDQLPAYLSLPEQRNIRAFRLRKSAQFVDAKLHRPFEGKQWGTDGLEAPRLTDELEAPILQTVTADAAPKPNNTRLINDTAVGIVIVGGTGDYAISEAEKDNIVAEVQEGLTWLGSQEDDANVSWVFDVKDVTLNNVTPWSGARWSGMPENFYKGIDAAFVRKDNGKLYMFKGNQYVRFSAVANGVDEGYPKPIAGNWPGLPASFNAGIDAVIWRQSNDKIYFFKGSEYCRFSKVSEGVDPGYPKPIAEQWPGMPNDFNEGIDAALMNEGNGKIYLFKKGQYVRFSSVAAGVDSGYPKPIKDNWKGVPDSYHEGINAALWRDSNDKIYLFKNGRMNGSYVQISNLDSGVDDGYPKPIGLSGAEAEAQWRDPALAKLGYEEGDTGKDKFIADLRTTHETQWSYCLFFTKWPTTWFGYAGGGRVVMRYMDFSQAAHPNMDRVISHETGHIFGCPDEYDDSGCDCGKESGRFFKEPNNNCAHCEPDLNLPCVMRSNSPAMCPHTPWHLGWGAFMTGINAALWRRDVGKIYMFSNHKYLRITDVSAGHDEGYPTNISAGWKGLPATFRQGIDAALWREDNAKAYLFKGNQYVRFSTISDGVDPGYPRSIADHWPGLPASFQQGIDAAFWRESNGKIYMFKGSQYVRISNVSEGVDPGYPRSIAGNWNGLPASYATGIDAVLMRWDNHKIYFFKGKRYVRYDDAGAMVDPGYPTTINGNWFPFPR
ncbi:MAG: hemopexin repeat-containing protein [Chitinophagaceae bacterium]